jgi:two-component SAPR family response regulator
MAGSLLLAGFAVHAQDYDRGRYPDNDRYRDDRGYNRGGSLIEQVQGDLSYAQSAVYSRSERKRLDNARKELWEFQRAWSAGRFNHHELNDSIAAIQKVVDHRGLDERARSVLWNDLERLREFRAQYEGRRY